MTEGIVLGFFLLNYSFHLTDEQFEKSSLKNNCDFKKKHVIFFCSHPIYKIALKSTKL